MADESEEYHGPPSKAEDDCGRIAHRLVKLPIAYEALWSELFRLFVHLWIPHASPAVKLSQYGQYDGMQGNSDIPYVSQDHRARWDEVPIQHIISYGAVRDPQRQHGVPPECFLDDRVHVDERLLVAEVGQAL